MSNWDYFFYMGGLTGWCIVIVFIFIVWIDHKLPDFCYAFTTHSRLKRKYDRLHRRLTMIQAIKNQRTNVDFLKAEIEKKEKELAEAAFKQPQEFIDTD